jgi:hypothetical protein
MSINVLRQGAGLLRAAYSAIATPVAFSFGTGHFRSSIARAAVDRHGNPLPWYSYPCIDFLATRTFSNCEVLEFGGGQSTRYWSKRAKYVTTFDGNQEWLKRLQGYGMPNVVLHLVDLADEAQLLTQIRNALLPRNGSGFDVVVIDGLYWRGALAEVAIEVMAKDGAIVCDNANSKVHDYRARFAASGLRRLDFLGFAPGTRMRDCTSVFFGEDCFLFDNKWPIPGM